MRPGKNTRIDRLLVELGKVSSRESAQRLIRAGQVLVDEQVIDKPGSLVPAGVSIRVKEQEKYVGRGGYKLAAALEHFQVSPEGQTCLDVGASTGGFTDCLLQLGAKRVFAVDVGYNQIAWKLRVDSRVTVLEKVNARYLTVETLGAKAGLAVADVSFISLTLVLPAIFSCLNSGSFVIVLIKPQFELAPSQVSHGGVVKDDNGRRAAVERIRDYTCDELQREWLGVIESPIRGAKGNQEYLACLR
jgi:23S rRNA (cytidine1920-2'-O)/16S rRNA (cytidine1409-2'-O)-methyltransferase